MYRMSCETTARYVQHKQISEIEPFILCFDANDNINI